MKDSEIIRLCAKAVGDEVCKVPGHPGWWSSSDLDERFDPLHNDGQAMNLVKKFHLMIGYSAGWSAQKLDGECNSILRSATFHYPDLNRAICECVANIGRAGK